MSEESSPRLDQLILKYAGQKTAREIAELSGEPESRVLSRKDELLDAIDILTVDQKRQQLLVKLQVIADEAHEMAQTADHKTAAGLFNSATTAINSSLKQVAALEAKMGGEVQALNEKRVRELLRLVDMTVVKAVDVIADRYDLDHGDLMAVFQEKLVEAAREIEA